MWSRYQTAPTSQCGLLFVARLNLVDALKNCFVRSDQQDFILYSTTLYVITTQQRTSLRNELVTRTARSSIRLTIRAPLSVQINASTIYVSGRPDFINNTSVFFADMINQEFNPSNYETTVTFLTSIPYPFELVLSAPLANNEQINTLYTVSPSTDYALSSPQFVAVNGLVCGVSGQPCTQTWRLVVSRSVPICTLQASLNITFAVTCSSSYPGNCSLAGFPRYVPSLTFDLASTDFCTVLVGDGAITANLATYNDAAFTRSNLNFLFSQVVYFEANILVLVGPDVASTRVERVIVSSYQQSKVTLLASDSRLTINNNFANSPSKVRFWFLLDNSVVTLAGSDAAQIIQVEVLFQVTYQNLNSDTKTIRLSSNEMKQVSNGGEDVENDNDNNNNMNLMAAPYSTRTSAATTFAMNNRNTRSTTTTSSSQSSSDSLTSSTTIIGVVAGAAAAVIAIIAFAIYRVNKRKSPKGMMKTIIQPPQAKEVY